MTRAAVVRERGRSGAGFVAAGLLLAGLALGLAAPQGQGGEDLHAATALAATAFAIGTHVRRGTGADFVASLALIVVVALGFGIQGGAGTAVLHLALAVPAVALSASLLVRPRPVGARAAIQGQNRSDSEDTAT